MPSCRRSTGVLTGICLIAAVATASSTDLNPFWHAGGPALASQTLFEGERFPNVAVALDGSVIATWGSRAFQVRRSEDGGVTWGPVTVVAQPGFHGGGLTVDEHSGAVFAFVEQGHPPAPLALYRSTDHGRTWRLHAHSLLPDSLGHLPAMHMNERGLTLLRGPHAGRLIRAARWYAGGNDRQFWPEHYANAIYSDDGGQTWQTSEPFPARGTGEAALVELADGRLLYNSRRHLSTDGRNPRRRHVAWSHDGGVNWRDLEVSTELPDGDQSSDYGLMAGLARLPVEGHDILLFSNVDSREGRRRGTIWASFDGGRTWPVKRLVDEGGFAYSSLAAGRAGTPSEGWVYLLHETGGHPDSAGRLVRFNLAWATEGRDWRGFLPKISAAP